MKRLESEPCHLVPLPTPHKGLQYGRGVGPFRRTTCSTTRVRGAFTSARTHQPGWISPAASMDASGCINWRCMVRFNSRAPYSTLVPWRSSRRRHSSSTLSSKPQAPRRGQDAPAVHQLVEMLVENSGQFLAAERLIGNHGVDAVDEFGRELSCARVERDTAQLAVPIARLARHAAFESERGRVRAACRARPGCWS